MLPGKTKDCLINDCQYIYAFGLLQAKVALLVATEGEKLNSYNHSKFNYFLAQISYLQDSYWSGIVSIILIEKMYLKIMLSTNLYLWLLNLFPLKTLSIIWLYYEIRTSLLSTL